MCIRAVGGLGRKCVYHSCAWVATMVAQSPSCIFAVFLHASENVDQAQRRGVKGGGGGSQG
jgi:hypothetical protein